jgi:peptide-methionine (S)-S-oxide reductase
MNKTLETATLAGGCFWCTEAIFIRLKGVVSVTSGYSGGPDIRATYSQVSTGNTGHAEAIQIVFDPKIISYDKLLDVFWATHNPTTRNQQGADIGPQYRSIIFYHDEKQKASAEKSKEELVKSKIYNDPVVTEIIPFENFSTAEDYHQNYYDNNRSYPYCSVVIDPKIHKLLEKYGRDVKEEYKQED